MGESTATLIPIIAFLVFGVLINFQKLFCKGYKGYKKLGGVGKMSALLKIISTMGKHRHFILNHKRFPFSHSVLSSWKPLSCLFT